MDNNRRSADTGPRSVLLKCPKCCGALTGVSIDRVFFCTSCRIAVDFWEDPPGITPVVYAESPVETSFPIVWLPAWRYRTDIRIEGEEDVAVQAARAAVPEYVFVFGSVFQRISVYGDPNVDFTASGTVIPEGRQAHDVIGCQLRRVHADKLVSAVAVSVIDKARDVTDLDIQIMIRQRDLCAMPFQVTGNYLTEPYSRMGINRMAYLMEPALPAVKESDR